MSFACGRGAATTIAPRATPNVLSRARINADFIVDVSAVPNERTCAAGFERHACVQGFRDAIGTGVEDVLRLYMAHDPRDPGVVAIFRLVEFAASPASISTGQRLSAVFLSLSWQFELRARDGRPLMQLAARTDSPDVVVLDRPMGFGVRSLLNRVLEFIGYQLNVALERNTLESGAAPAIDTTTPPSIL